MAMIKEENSNLECGWCLHQKKMWKTGLTINDNADGQNW